MVDRSMGMERDLATLKLKELELNALLEITQAINNNLAEEALYKIYHFTLLANFDIKQLALYVLDSDWKCKVNFGTTKKFTNIPLPDRYIFTNEKVEPIPASDQDFGEFKWVFPVLHKQNLLAVVFIGNLSDSANTIFLEALTNIILVAIENKKLAVKEIEREAFRKEMEIARNVQQFLFPKELPNTEKIKVAAAYHPHNEVGGDYYDYIPIDEHQFMICIADVSGKGVPAALLMSNFQAALRTLLRKTDDLQEITNVLNSQVRSNGNGEIYITFFGAIYDYTKAHIRYVSCGHNPSILQIEGENELRLLDEGTTVLGMFEPLPFLTIGEIQNVRAFSMYHYTDGITETLNDNDEEFGIQRFMDIVQTQGGGDLDQFNNQVIQALHEFKGSMPFKDDLTLLSCTVNS